MTRDPRIQAARALRRAATAEERRVWGLITPLNRAKRAHFRRQAVIGPFTVDFADLSRRLVVEIDDSQPGGAIDAARDGWLASQGFRVLRFWNSDVRENPEGVYTRILDALETLEAPHPLPPHKGEGSAFVANGSAHGPLPLVGRDGVGGGLPPDRAEGE